MLRAHTLQDLGEAVTRRVHKVMSLYQILGKEVIPFPFLICVSFLSNTNFKWATIVLSSSDCLSIAVREVIQ